MMEKRPKCVGCGKIPEEEGWNRCFECRKKAVKSVECTMAKDLLIPDAYPAERMHSEDGGALAELVEKGSDQFMKEEPELAPAQVSDKPVRITDGIMNYVTKGSPWPEMTELEFNDFMEVAFGSSELETYWKRGGWEIDRKKGEFTKGDLHISIEAAVDLRRTWEIGPAETPKHTEVRAIGLLRRWYTLSEGINTLDQDTQYFLEEIDGVRKSDEASEG